MRTRSLKRQKQEREYKKLRDAFMDENQHCQAALAGCNYVATDVHHKAGRVGLKLTDVSDFLAVCRPCHHWIENNAVQAKELGLSKSRL